MSETYPVLINGEKKGTLTVSREGLTTRFDAKCEDPGTLEEVYEPFLIQEGFIKRTPRGREVTPLAYQHLGITPQQLPGYTPGLFD